MQDGVAVNEDKYTIQELMLDVGGGHEVYVQDWGNKSATQVILRLHGGPGSASKDSYKRLYDPQTQRVVFHDQRGCGKSLPYGSLRHNTTDDLVEDISKIADKLGISKFILQGTSWGSTLALAYALAHPERVEALVIGGVFTASKAETDWLDDGLMRTFYPEVWEGYAGSVPEKYRDDPSGYHFQRILHGTDEEQKESAYQFSRLEGGVMFFDDMQPSWDYETFDPVGSRIEVHYLANACFMPERHIFDHATELTMPVHIVQGRYDMVCPPQTAYELAQKLPDARLYWTLSNHQVQHEGNTVFRAIFDGMR